MVRKGTPSVLELERLGVARVSTASGPFRAAMALTRRVAAELLATGTYASFLDEAIPGHVTGEDGSLPERGNDRRKPDAGELRGLTRGRWPKGRPLIHLSGHSPRKP